MSERDQVGVLVLRADGTHGGMSLRSGFKFAIRTGDAPAELVAAASLL